MYNGINKMIFRLCVLNVPVSALKFYTHLWSGIGIPAISVSAQSTNYQYDTRLQIPCLHIGWYEAIVNLLLAPTEFVKPTIQQITNLICKHSNFINKQGYNKGTNHRILLFEVLTVEIYPVQKCSPFKYWAVHLFHLYQSKVEILHPYSSQDEKVLVLKISQNIVSTL